jgi:hypothetical protein
MPQTKVQLASGWDELAAAMKAPDTECPGEFGNIEEAIAYLRSVLGDDYLDQVCQIRKHPFRGLMFLSWPGLRSDFLDWIGHLRRVRGCPNVDRIFRDLRVASKCVHAYGVLRLAGKICRNGFDIAFEPESAADFRLRPDIRIYFAPTHEIFFLEFSGQSLAGNQLSGFEAMTACSQPVNRYFETLKHVFRLRTIPAPEHMEEIVQRIEAAVQRVLTTGRLAEVIDEGTLEMAICLLPNVKEFEAWCSKRGLHPGGHEGPQDKTNHLERLRQKIRRKQKQLPNGYPNILAIENHNLFTDCPNTARLVSELQEELYRHPNLALLLLEGSYGSGRDEPPMAFRLGDHRFERRFRKGHVGHTLLCLNRYAATMASTDLVAALSHAVFGCIPRQPQPATET